MCDTDLSPTGLEIKEGGSLSLRDSFLTGVVISFSVFLVATQKGTLVF
jgi:hypothetical protein